MGRCAHIANAGTLGCRPWAIERGIGGFCSLLSLLIRSNHLRDAKGAKRAVRGLETATAIAAKGGRGILLQFGFGIRQFPCYPWLVIQVRSTLQGAIGVLNETTCKRCRQFLA